MPTTPTNAPRSVAPREQGVEYHVEHHADAEHGDRIFVVTNADGAESFGLMVAPAASADRSEWRTILPARPDVRIADVDAFAGHLVVSERAAGLEQLRVVPIVDGDVRVADAHIVEMPEDVYSVWIGGNPEFASHALRFGYTSLVAPMTDIDYDVETRATRHRQGPTRRRLRLRGLRDTPVVGERTRRHPRADLVGAPPRLAP